ncbi:unnamed protein product [Vitrella brassicaformis CCMP3155]|uniref:Uncharacterized protein n=1 Tax=Vitrella brassicaformis (strain CCMP3155) TaxID=1169540 RepID=A0A0G4GYI0_VITBC|nr:unnamed protein product [Vitrella brassicaformis CCMP3155]|eukprot:CEM36180.1 unnamed protein product [Vitrella brassicaformis CCMP3155]
MSGTARLYHIVNPNHPQLRLWEGLSKQPQVYKLTHSSSPPSQPLPSFPSTVAAPAAQRPPTVGSVGPLVLPHAARKDERFILTPAVADALNHERGRESRPAAGPPEGDVSPPCAADDGGVREKERDEERDGDVGGVGEAVSGDGDGGYECRWQPQRAYRSRKYNRASYKSRRRWAAMRR